MIHKKRVKLVADYQYFQLKALELGIEKLNMKGVDVYKRTFVEIIISVSYFRVPQFRKRFLEIIREKGDIEIPEWRATDEALLDEDLTVEERFASPAISHMFNWQ